MARHDSRVKRWCEAKFCFLYLTYSEGTIVAAEKDEITTIIAKLVWKQAFISFFGICQKLQPWLLPWFESRVSY